MTGLSRYFVDFFVLLASCSLYQELLCIAGIPDLCPHNGAYAMGWHITPYPKPQRVFGPWDMFLDDLIV